MDRFSVRLHGLGGQGLKSMIQEILAPVLLRSGFHVQAFPFFGGERRGAQVAGYLRCGRNRITAHSFITKPDMAVIFDHERIPMTKALEGLKPGGIALINTSSPNQFMGLTRDWQVYTLNARAISLAHGIGEPSDPYMVINSAMAGGVLGVMESVLGVQFPNDAIEEALVDALSQRSPENLRAFSDGRRTIVRLMADGMPMWQWLAKEKGVPHLTQPDGRCTSCNICYLFCPKRAIEATVEGKYIIHEDKCNYCAICVAVCPRGAITIQTEEILKPDGSAAQGLKPDGSAVEGGHANER